MRNFIVGLIFAMLALAQPAAAQNRPVVVELYTSQGCSSCPPADEILAELAQRDDIIALALHVDYWDYLGWKDNFASPAFSNRQRAYARAAQRRTVYTPQVIVQGVSPVVGNRPHEVASAIQRHSQGALAPVELTLRREEGTLFITARATGEGVGRSVIQVVRYMPEAWVDIRGGENAGRRMYYANIVTDWTPLALWNGRGEFTAQAPLEGDYPVVVLVQAADYGPILAAGRLR